jgi:hypothetical protein
MGKYLIELVTESRTHLENMALAPNILPGTIGGIFKPKRLYHE